MRLTAEQQAMAAGSAGEAAAQAIAMLLAVGKAVEAERLIPVVSAHIVIDAVTLGEPGLRQVESLARAGGRFVVPTTINAVACDRRADPATYSGMARRQHEVLQAGIAMGGLATCSCNPIGQGVLPSFGQSVAWSESGTAPYVNGVLGARSNREGATSLASALTGLTPDYGMHRPESRRGDGLIDIAASVSGVDGFGLLGLHVARRWPGRIPVLRGLPPPQLDEWIAFASSFAIAGAAPMFHAIGLTPEAPSLAAAFPDGAPSPERVTDEDLRAERGRLESETGETIDMVVLGCPHASLQQLAEAARRFDGRRVKAGIDCVLHTSQGAYALAQAAGHVAALTQAGARLTVGEMCYGCDFRDSRFPDGARVATNSGKLLFVAPGSQGARLRLADAAACIEAAVSGRLARYNR